MPEFGTVLTVKDSDRMLSHDEIVRAIRFNIAAEYEAVQLYQQLANSIDDELAKAVLQDIAREEIVHAGEFMRLLHELAPDEQAAYDDGFKEVEEIIAETKGARV